MVVEEVAGGGSHLPHPHSPLLPAPGVRESVPLRSLLCAQVLLLEERRRHRQHQPPSPPAPAPHGQRGRGVAGRAPHTRPPREEGQARKKGRDKPPAPTETKVPPNQHPTPPWEAGGRAPQHGFRGTLRGRKNC